MKRTLKTIKNALSDKTFLDIIKELINNEKVQEMQKYRQHYDVTTYEHCLNVSYISYKIARFFKWDYESVARAAMLHDLFLYDWRNSKRELGLESYHAFVHPKIALKNASAEFRLNEKEKDIILKHMWPVTISLPKYKESYLITLIDKYSAIQESINYYQEYIQSKKMYRYAYIFLCLIFLKKIM